MNLLTTQTNRSCEICGDEVAITVCVIDGESVDRCESHAWGLIPETERTYWQTRNNADELFLQSDNPNQITEESENEV